MVNRTAMLLLVLTGACRSETIEVIPPDLGLPVKVITADQLNSPREIEAVPLITVAGEPAGLTYVPAVDVLGTGIAVLDQVEAAVLVFDSSGRLSGRTPGEGDGPGELRRPAHLVVLNDSVYVIDQNGLNVFDAALRFTRRERLVTAAAGGTTNFLPFPQSLHASAGHLVTSFRSGGRSSEQGSAVISSVHRLGLDGIVAPAFAQVITDHVYKVSGSTDALPWFLPRSEFAAAGDGTIYVSLQDGIRLRILNREGEPEGEILLNVPRRRVTSAAVDSAKEHVSKLMGMIAPGAEPAGPRPVARYRSVVGTVVPGDSGQILIKRPDLSAVYGTSAPVTWDLINRQGTVMGRVLLPADFRPRVLRLSRLLGVQGAEGDVPDVVAFELRIPPQAGKQ